MKFNICKNKHGFFSVTPMPSAEYLEDFYKKTYYQEGMQEYCENYTSDELDYFSNESIVAEYIYKTHSSSPLRNLLDVGCGEGYFAKYFFENNYGVVLLDYSSYGLRTHNPELLDYFIEGNIYANLDNKLYVKKFDFINIKNVIEHVIDPYLLLSKAMENVADNSIIRIEVPNDYSTFQSMLLEKKLSENTWFKPPEHLHYFNFTSMKNFLSDLGYEVKVIMSDFPIELFLLNKHSNYVANKNFGKQAHYARAIANNYLMSKGPEKYVNFFQACAELDFGRQIIVYCNVAK